MGHALPGPNLFGGHFLVFPLPLDDICQVSAPWLGVERSDDVEARLFPEGFSATPTPNMKGTIRIYSNCVQSNRRKLVASSHGLGIMRDDVLVGDSSV